MREYTVSFRKPSVIETNVASRCLPVAENTSASIAVDRKWTGAFGVIADIADLRYRDIDIDRAPLAQRNDDFAATRFRPTALRISMTAEPLPPVFPFVHVGLSYFTRDGAAAASPNGGLN